MKTKITAIEYGLIASLIAVAIIGPLVASGQISSHRTRYDDVYIGGDEGCKIATGGREENCRDAEAMISGIKSGFIKLKRP